MLPQLLWFRVEVIKQLIKILSLQRVLQSCILGHELWCYYAASVMMTKAKCGTSPLLSVTATPLNGTRFSGKFFFQAPAVPHWIQLELMLLTAGKHRHAAAESQKPTSTCVLWWSHRIKLYKADANTHTGPHAGSAWIIELGTFPCIMRPGHIWIIDGRKWI